MTIRSAVVRLSADVSGLIAGYQRAKIATTDLARSAATYGQTHEKALRQVGSAAGTMAVAAGAGFVAAVASAAQFDKAMSAVQAATHEGAAGMSALRDAAMEAGAATQFSNTEAAGAIENLAKAGISTADILGGALTGSLDLAAAGSLGVADAAEFMATALTQFNMEGDQATHVADLLAAGAGKAQGEVVDMATALNYAGIPAAQLGVSIEETAGTLALFAKNGLIGSQAGTSMRGVLMSLTSPSQVAAKTMEELGINVFDAQGKFVGFDGVAGQLRKTMGGLTDAERANALGRIFGNQQIQAANILYANGAKAVHQWTAAVNDEGYAAETAAIKMDNLSGDLEKLGGAFSTALTGAGEGQQGGLRTLVQGVTSVVDAFNSLPPAAQGFASTLLGVSAVMGAGVWAGTKIVTGISNASSALSDLGIKAGTTRTALAGIGKGVELFVIVEGLKAIDSAFDDLTNSTLQVDGLTRSLEALANGNVTGNLADTFGGDLTKVGESLTTIGSNWAQVSNAISGPLPGSSELDRASDRIRTLDESLAGLVETGNVREARAAFEEISAAALKGGASMEDITSGFEQYQIALDNLKGGDKGAGLDTMLGLDGFVKDLGTVPPAAQAAASAVDNFKASLSALQGMLDQRAAVRNYQAAIDDFHKSFKRIAGDDFNIDVDPGRQNQAKLDAIASSAAQVAEGLQGIRRQRFVDNAIGQLRNMARSMGIPQSAVADLIGGLRLLGNTDAHPKVRPDGIPNSHRDLDGVQRHVHDVDGASAHPNVSPDGIPSSHNDLSGVQRHVGDVDRARANPVVTAATGQAMGALSGILGFLHAVDGYHATSSVSVVTTRTNHTINTVEDRHIGVNANGGLWRFAGGGYMPPIGAQQPQIRPYSGPRGLTWSEEGSGPWEAFISGHPGKVDRSRAIASDVVARLGGEARFASGGFTRPGGGATTGTAATVTLTDDQFRRLEAATERGTAKGAARGMTTRNQSAFAGRRT